jgi:hypothetical protein
MVTIARRHHDDSRMLPIFGELAADRSDIIDQVRDGERPPMIYLGCYYGAPLPPYDDTRGVRLPPLKWGSSGGSSNCTSGTRDTLLLKLRAESLMYYADAIETILKTGDYSSPELRQLETAAFRMARNARVRMRYGEGGGSFAYCSGGTLDDYLAVDILNSCLAPVGRAGAFVAANVGGNVSLLRLIIYEARSAASAADRARAIVELADWNLVSIPVDRRQFNERVMNWTRSTYTRAYRELQRGDGASESAVELFAPEIPVTLPAFEPNPFVSAAAIQSSRFIDVRFAVTRYGRGEDVEIVATSDDITRGEKRDLIFLIESTTFRPRLVDGALADSAPVSLRYRLSP